MFKITSPRRKVLVQTLILGVWLALIISAYGYLVLYAATPGQDADPPRLWPRDTTMVLAQNQPTMIVFLHPKCVCSRATVAEMSRIMTKGKDKVKVYVLMLLPDGLEADWARSDLWQQARDIPSVTALIDRDGHESNRFNCQTSGHILVYKPNGKLVFSGGITASRGHEGENNGRSAVEALILNKTPDTESNPVFGCPLHER